MVGMRGKRSRDSGRMGYYIGMWEWGWSWEVGIKFEEMGLFGSDVEIGVGFRVGRKLVLGGGER